MPLQLQYRLFSNLLQMEKGEGEIKHLLFTHVWIFNIFFPLIASPLSSSSVNSPRAEFRSQKYVRSIQIFPNALSNSLLNSEKCYLWKYIYAFHKPKARYWCHLLWAITTIYSLYRKCSQFIQITEFEWLLPRWIQHLSTHRLLCAVPRNCLPSPHGSVHRL